MFIIFLKFQYQLLNSKNYICTITVILLFFSLHHFLVIAKNAFFLEGIKHNNENYSTSAICFELRDSDKCFKSSVYSLYQLFPISPTGPIVYC